MTSLDLISMIKVETKINDDSIREGDIVVETNDN